MDVRRPTLPTRALSWAVCGPLGHLYGGTADWLEVAARVLLARARGRGIGEA